MRHDAIENLSSEPPTPTASSVSSQLSFEDVSSIDSGMSDPIVAPKEHPMYFIRDGMVTIQVEDTLFRVPQYFLTTTSTYFADFLKGHDVDDIVYLKDADLSSSAFANLISVLHPLLGVTPISTLTEWTDVLHLSTKWGFEYLRTAAIAAILPLASAVDKLVLGRAYDFSDWVPGAYGDLLAREEDLTLEEAEKMALKDVVAIARGRREARTQKVRPRGEIDNIVKALLPDSGGSMDVIIAASRSSGTDVSSASNKTNLSDTITVAPGQDDEHDRAQILRWLDQWKMNPTSESPRQCLLEFSRQGRTYIPLVLHHFIAQGLSSFVAAPAVQRKVLTDYDRYRQPIYSDVWETTADDGSHQRLKSLSQQDHSLGLIQTEQLKSVCLRAVNQWCFLSDLDLDAAVSDIKTGQPWKDFIRSVLYLAFLVDQGILQPSVFATFWTTLGAPLQLHTPSAKYVRIFSTLLDSVKAYVSRREVSIEMDAFYQKLESVRDAAQTSPQDDEVRNLIQALTEMIDGRQWTQR